MKCWKSNIPSGGLSRSNADIGKPGRKLRGNTMTDKELHRLKRSELLELMLEQSKEITQLKKQLMLAEKKRKNRELAIKDVGSIAEASIALSSVFVEAQEAADLYLENVKRICRERAEQAGVAEAWERFEESVDQRESAGDVGE